MLYHGNKLVDVHPDLKRLVTEYCKTHSLVVVCGFRSFEDQMIAYKNKKTKALPGKSLHNFKPSRAVDLAPTLKGEIDWKNLEAFDAMGEELMALAKQLGIKIRWGKYFRNLVDSPHFELI